MSPARCAGATPWSAPNEMPEHERPRYLLLLGDLEQVSARGWARASAHGAFVGRLALQDEAALGAYCDKVIAWERGSRELPRALYYTAQDGTSAISAGYRHLVQPCIENNRSLARGRQAATRAIHHRAPQQQRPGGAARRGRAQRGQRAAVAVTRARGPAPRLEQPRAAAPPHAGALCIGLDAPPLDAAALGTEAFLPGGVWFMVACFGGGTPATSAYHPWLRTLARSGR